MNDNLKEKLKVQIDRNIHMRVRLLKKAEKINAKIRALEAKKSNIYKKEHRLEAKTNELVEVYNADKPITAFNTLREKRLKSFHDIPNENTQ